MYTGIFLSYDTTLIVNTDTKIYTVLSLVPPIKANVTILALNAGTIKADDFNWHQLEGWRNAVCPDFKISGVA